MFFEAILFLLIINTAKRRQGGAKPCCVYYCLLPNLLIGFFKFSLSGCEGLALLTLTKVRKRATTRCETRLFIFDTFYLLFAPLLFFPHFAFFWWGYGEVVQLVRTMNNSLI